MIPSSIASGLADRLTAAAVAAAASAAQDADSVGSAAGTGSDAAAAIAAGLLFAFVLSTSGPEYAAVECAAVVFLTVAFAEIFDGGWLLWKRERS